MADNYNAGTAYVHVDGKNYVLKGSLTYRLDGENREPMIGMNGYNGNKITLHPGEIKGKFSNGERVDIAALNALDNATVTCELANGKTVVGRNMSRTGEPIEVDTEEGEFELEFTGPSVREV